MAILIGGSAAISAYQTNQQTKAANSAAQDQEKEMVANQNKMVEDSFKKQRQARGLGQQSMSPAGNMASQSGAVLTSATNGNASSLM